MHINEETDVRTHTRTHAQTHARAHTCTNNTTTHVDTHAQTTQTRTAEMHEHMKKCRKHRLSIHAPGTTNGIVRANCGWIWTDEYLHLLSYGPLTAHWPQCHVQCPNLKRKHSMPVSNNTKDVFCIHRFASGHPTSKAWVPITRLKLTKSTSIFLCATSVLESPRPGKSSSWQTIDWDQGRRHLPPTAKLQRFSPVKVRWYCCHPTGNGMHIIIVIACSRCYNETAYYLRLFMCKPCSISTKMDDYLLLTPVTRRHRALHLSKLHPLNNIVLYATDECMTEFAPAQGCALADAKHTYPSLFKCQTMWERYHAVHISVICDQPVARSIPPPFWCRLACVAGVLSSVAQWYFVSDLKANENALFSCKPIIWFQWKIIFKWFDWLIILKSGSEWDNGY